MKHLQRSRRKGTKTLGGAIYVGRPTMFGNPFMADRFGHLKAVRQGLLGALREAEYAASDARQAIATESTEAARAYYAHERGLADGRGLCQVDPGERSE